MTLLRFAFAIVLIATGSLAAHAQTIVTLGSGFNQPEGVAVDGSGDVFVGDTTHKQVKEILAAGGYSTVTTLGSAASGFSFLSGVAVDSSGNVFVADYGNSAVKEILAAGGYTTVNTLGSGFNRPYAVAVDGSGNVFVADSFDDAVKEIVAAGGYTTVITLGSGFHYPFGVAVDASGNVFVGDYGNHAVKEILAAGGYSTVTTLGSGFSYPAGVAVDSSGNVFVADLGSNAVKEILAAGGYATVNTLGSGFSAPQGVAVDSRGNVFVADSGNNAVKEILAPPPTTTSLVSNINPSVFGQNVTFTATVSGNSPTGTVAFKDGSTTLAGCGAVALSAGSAACSISTLSTATHSITADYSSDSNNAASTGSLAQVVDSLSISGSVSNLAGSGLTLHLDYGNGSEDVSPAIGATSFAFNAAVRFGASYTVSVSAQPTMLSQTCSVANGSGTIPNHDVSTVTVSCVTNAYTIGGAVIGLTGSGLVLQINGAGDVHIVGSSFMFATRLESGSSYVVSIRTQPAGQTCSIANATGNVTNANITNVTVSCVDAHAQLSLSIDDGGSFAIYGQTLSYLVTLTNSGNATASNVSVTSVLSASLDSTNAVWQCIGGGAGATCTRSGTGPLTDTATLPAGLSLNWIVTVPVLIATGENTVQMDVSASGATSVIDIDTLVIFRDGFNAANGRGISVIEDPLSSAAILGGDASIAFQLSTADDDHIDVVSGLRSGDIEITIERIVVGATDYVRILQHRQGAKASTTADRISAWVAVAPDATLSIASVAGPDGQRTVLLEGAVRPITLSPKH